MRDRSVLTVFVVALIALSVGILDRYKLPDPPPQYRMAGDESIREMVDEYEGDAEARGIHPGQYAPSSLREGCATIRYRGHLRKFCSYGDSITVGIGGEQAAPMYLPGSHQTSLGDSSITIGEPAK